MKNLVKYLNSLVAATITTLIILTSSFMVMLFSSGEEGYRTSYFGSIFFKSTPTPEDTLELEFGVANGVPIVITVVVLSVLYFVLLNLKKTRTKSS
ncbi:hypothetical protein [Lentibacillus saliphilus]|uniref:hypothetical protein n=1 Tax=Lentibacillus saliphilus TaxID=2737028 RepID=UPI001C309CD6|nr:hypothetical protein [Lentibacillus saliphilus]